MIVSTLIQKTINELSPNGLNLPEEVYGVFYALHYVQATYRWAQRVFVNSQDITKFTAGCVFNQALQDALKIRECAVYLLIATRIMDCVDQQNKLQKSWNKWKSAVEGNYLKPVYAPWSTKAQDPYFSESTWVWIRFNAEDLSNRVYLLFIRTYKVGENAFLLSLRIADAVDNAIDGLEMNSKIQNDGVNELFFNFSKWTNKFVENKELLVDGLRSRKEVIDIFLRNLSSVITSDQVINSAVESLNIASNFCKSANNATKTVDGFMFEWARKWAFDLATDLSLEEYFPMALLPPSKPSFTELEKKIDRYPDAKKVTRKINYTPTPSPMKNSCKTPKKVSIPK